MALGEGNKGKTIREGEGGGGLIVDVPVCRLDSLLLHGFLPLGELEGEGMGRGEG